MSDSPLRDSDLTAWLCAELPKLERFAEEWNLGQDLSAAVEDVRSGISTEQALRGQHLPIDALFSGVQGRGDPVTLNALGVDPVIVTGDYRCPARSSCGRREGRDDNGYEPVCELHRTVMRFAPRQTR